jgi:GTPase KRas protein
LRQIAYLQKAYKERIPMALVATRCDEETKLEVSIEEGEDLASDYEMKYFQTSAKHKISVEEPFLWIALQIKNPPRTKSTDCQVS